ncbi:E3.2.1.14 [Lepeophtheirus salmonis]|uniref:E3.2.1.14 n=1 Tax=Lepeophtheirus salmonis TaxID=72036 RepID=A0A7R8CL68_LEPSM|nr:E3.2.1.14 [Lepeophtheirus salmonis]CAF2852931.1 E3.2.1.14 [Lepeophtheirus salmonis]
MKLESRRERDKEEEMRQQRWLWCCPAGVKLTGNIGAVPVLIGRSCKPTLPEEASALGKSLIFKKIVISSPSSNSTVRSDIEMRYKQCLLEVRAVNFLLLLSSVAFVRTEREMEEKQFNVDGHNKVVVCYWGTWSNYRPKDGAFKPEDIDASLCTHLIYSFAGLDETESKIKSLDPWMDLEENYGLAGYRKDGTKVLKKYSAMARDAEKRALFVESVVNFLNKYNFDGLDIDWEYPAKRGGVPDDKKNFILLIQELHVAFKKHNFLLTAAIGAAPLHHR